MKPLANTVLIPLGLTAAASTADAGIHKKILGSGHNNTTTLIISNNEMEDKQESIKGVTETVQNEVKEQKGGFLSTLSGTLGASLLGNLLTRRRIYRAAKGKGINRAGEGILRADYGNKMDF